MSHDFLAEIVTKESVFVDATLGNGNDSLFFAPLVKKVFAFDVQEAAIEASRAKLEAAGLDNVDLILDGHEHLDNYLDSLDAAIFNLGYLPSADKSIITQATTTLEALSKILVRLKSGGRVAIMVYYGHKGGQEEKDSLLDFVSQLNQKDYTVMIYQALNQINQPPFLLMIEKLS